MRLLLRTLGSPLPTEVDCEGQDTLQAFIAQLRHSGNLGDADDARLKLVHHGRVLRDQRAKLAELCGDGDVLVVLLGRPVARPPAAAEPPPRGPTMRDINVAIREDLEAQGPGSLAAAEAAARRQADTEQQQQQQQQQQALAAAGGALEQALLSGEMGALRAYLEQLQEALGGAAVGVGGGGGGGGASAAGGVAAGGAGGGGIAGGVGGGTVAGAGDPANFMAAMDAFFGLGLAGHDGGPAGGDAMAGAAGAAAAAAAAGAAPGLHSEDEEEDEHGEGEFSTEEEEEDENEEEDDRAEHVGEGEEGEDYTDEDEEESQGYTDEDQEEGEHHAAQAAAGTQGQLLPPRVPDLDSAALAGLMEMGFPEPLCRNALLWGRNRFEPALDWLLSHSEDPAAADPLSDAQLARLFGRGPPRQGNAVDQGHLAHLVDMGFNAAQAEQALRAFNNSLPAAASWLLSVGNLAAAAAPLGGPASVSAAAGAGAGAGGDGLGGGMQGGEPQQQGELQEQGGEQQQQEEQLECPPPQQEQQEQACEGGWASQRGSDGSDGSGSSGSAEQEETLEHSEAAAAGMPALAFGANSSGSSGGSTSGDGVSTHSGGSSEDEGVPPGLACSDSGNGSDDDEEERPRQPES